MGFGPTAATPSAAPSTMRPVVWAQGSARLLDYGATVPGAPDARPLLVAPSLINRATILDLTEERSLMR